MAVRGHDLGVVARRQDRLEELAAELRDRHGVAVTIYECDLGDAGARRAFIEEVQAAPQTVVGLVNCAGFGTSGRFLDLDRDRELQQIEVNIAALVELTHAFVGSMTERGQGAILNVASIAAFQPLPGLATYSATKAFVQTFSEALSEELRGTGVSSTALCPGPVATEWIEIADADSLRFSPAMVPVKDVAAAGVDGMVKGKRSVVPGVLPQAAAIAGRYAPRTALLPVLRKIVKR
jgi:hypothetical protein